MSKRVGSIAVNVVLTRGFLCVAISLKRFLSKFGNKNPIVLSLSEKEYRKIVSMGDLSKKQISYLTEENFTKIHTSKFLFISTS